MPLELAALADLVEAVPRALVDALPVPQRRAVDVAVLRWPAPLAPRSGRAVTSRARCTTPMTAEPPAMCGRPGKLAASG